MKTAVIFLLLAASAFADEQPLFESQKLEYKNQPQMSSDFLGEPTDIGELRIGDHFWVPAHALVVDMNGKCWLDPKCKLDEKSDHVIKVGRFKKNVFDDKQYLPRTVIGYSVFIDKEKLQGWRWKLSNVNILARDKLIRVKALSYSFQ